MRINFLKLLTCRSNKNIKWWAIIGSTSIEEENEDDELTKRSFDLGNYLIHHQYERGKKYFDVAMVKLDHPVKLNDQVTTVCLPEVRAWSIILFILNQTNLVFNRVFNCILKKFDTSI